MSTSYIAILIDNDADVYPVTACFAPWYFKPGLVAKYIVFIPKHANETWIKGGYGDDSNPFNLSDIVQYFDLLQEIWHFNYNLRDTEPNGNDVISVEVPVDKNGILGTQLLLNALRYLYESPMQQIVKNFINNSHALIEQDIKLNKALVFELLLKAHDGISYTRGHTMLQHSYQELMGFKESFKPVALSA